MIFSYTLAVVQSSGPSDDSLVLCSLHSETPSHARTPSRPLALDRRGLAPSTRIVSPCFTRPRFQQGLSSRAPQDFTKRAQSTRSIWSWLTFISLYSTLQVLQRGHFSSYERCSSWKTLFSCLQLGSFALRQERVFGPSDVSRSSKNKTSSVRPQS